MAWIDLLKKLVALQGVLKANWADVMLIVAAIQRIAANLVPAATTGGLEQYEKSAEEVALEAELSSLLAGDGAQAVIDLSTLFMLWRLAQQVPEIATLLNGLFDFLANLARKPATA